MMKKFKAAMMTLAASAITFGWFGGSCSQYWGDVLGDALWLNAID